MKQKIKNTIFVTVGLFAIAIGVVTVPSGAAAKDYTFKMWIAPLECTRNEISDGITTTTILTPKQCDDLLHPPSKPQPGEPNKPTPSAPDTGKFSDTWTTIVMTSILLILGIGITILAVHNSKAYKRTNLQEKRH
ncbi:MAG TPA: hypothetical protein VGE34_01730 [Candidatus Saccharimonadales bacterium]